MKLILFAIFCGLFFGYIIIPISLTYLFCKKFTWENIKRIYSLLFDGDIE
jgi:hypothetical protein